MLCAIVWPQITTLLRPRVIVIVYKLQLPAPRDHTLTSASFRKVIESDSSPSLLLQYAIMADQKSSITFSQRLGLLPAVFRIGIFSRSLNVILSIDATIAFKSIASALYTPFRGQYGQTTMKRHIMLSLMRHSVGELSPGQLQLV